MKMSPFYQFRFIALGYVMMLVYGCQKGVVQSMVDIQEHSDIQEILINDKSEIVFPELTERQSMFFYEEKALFVIGQVCDIYDLRSFRRESQFVLPSGEYSIPHANTICPGPQKYSSESVFPAMYVSSWNNGRQAFVYDIIMNGNSYEASLIQVIDPANVRIDIIGGGYLDWVVDCEAGFIYSIAYHLKNTSIIEDGNYTHVTKFVLPSLEKGIVYLQDSDIIDFFDVPVMTVFQDKCFIDGYIFVVAGNSKLGSDYYPKLFSINTKTKSMTELQIPLYGEPEGLCFYEGQLWMNMFESTKVFNLNKLMSLSW